MLPEFELFVLEDDGRVALVVTRGNRDRSDSWIIEASEFFNWTTRIVRFDFFAASSDSFTISCTLVNNPSLEEITNELVWRSTATVI